MWPSRAAAKSLYYTVGREVITFVIVKLVSLETMEMHNDVHHEVAFEALGLITLS